MLYSNPGNDVFQVFRTRDGLTSSGELSVGRDVRGAKCTWGEMSVGRDVVGRVVVRRDVLGRVVLGRVVLGRVVRVNYFINTYFTGSC